MANVFLDGIFKQIFVSKVIMADIVIGQKINYGKEIGLTSKEEEICKIYWMEETFRNNSRGRGDLHGNST